MNITFNSELALKYGGTEIAILLQNLFFWITHNRKKNINCRENKFWSYSSLKGLQEKFPFLSFSQIRNAMNKLIKDGVIIKGNFNKCKYDRTSWWAFKNDQVLNEIAHLLNPQMEPPKKTVPESQDSTPIQDINTNLKKEVEEVEEKETTAKIDSALYEQLILRKLSHSQAEKIISSKESEYILEKIRQYDYILSHNSKKMKNKARFLFCSIINNWQDEQYYQHEKDKQKQSEKESMIQKQNEKEKKKQEYNDYVENMAEECFKALPEAKKQGIIEQGKRELNKMPFYRNNENLLKIAVQTKIIRHVIDKELENIPSFEEYYLNKEIISL